MFRSRVLRVVLITAAAGLAVPAALVAQQAPRQVRAPQVDVARLPAVQQVGTVDVRGRTLPLYRGRAALRAQIGSRGGVLRLATHDLRVVVPPGASASSSVGVQASEAWPCKLQPLRRVGPAMKLVGEIADASAPLIFEMRVPDLAPQPGHRLVLVGVQAPEADARAIKVEWAQAAPGAGPSQLRARARARQARALGARAGGRALGARALGARAREGREAGARPTPRRSRRLVMRERPYEVWTGTLDGQRVHIASAFYDPRTDHLMAEFDGVGSFQSFEFGWLSDDTLETRALRKRPGRVKAAAGVRSIRAVPRR